MAELEVVRTAAVFSAALDAERSRGRRVGLVPTMGDLHAGHRSLIALAAAECDAVAVTVFVNPLQFDDPADLRAYRRDLAGDISTAVGAGATILFAPDVEEMYPGFPEPPATVVHVAGVSEGLEGASRPGHFDGVATVVAKLFSLAGRCRAYFGEKDFQQLAVVRRLVADLAMPVEVVACPTVRLADGLALSSRNARLTPEARQAALALRRSLDAGLALLHEGETSPAAVSDAMRRVLEDEPLAHTHYAEVVDAHTLRAPDTLHGEVRLLVAAEVGGIRLIDNDGTVLGDRARSGAAGRPAAGSGPVPAGNTTTRTKEREPCGAA